MSFRQVVSCCWKKHGPDLWHIMYIYRLWKIYLWTIPILLNTNERAWYYSWSDGLFFTILAKGSVFLLSLITNLITKNMLRWIWFFVNEFNIANFPLIQWDLLPDGYYNKTSKLNFFLEKICCNNIFFLCEDKFYTVYRISYNLL